MYQHILEAISTTSFIISFLVSLCTAAYFILRQYNFYSFTKKNLDIYRKFFDKSGRYETITESEATEKDLKSINRVTTYDSYEEGEEEIHKETILLKNVANSGAELLSLIQDINEYLMSCKGTATFNIIQNKTERRITKLYDKAVSKASFPTHYGLMGTFIGVFLGLFAFLLVSIVSGEGITDDAIHSLIFGVLVSMSTSFIGLRMSTDANDKIGNTKNKIDDDKNEFYEYIQNKLMPSVDVSLTDALGKLHETVTTFEPSFSHVIEGFKTTFNQCTTAFGEDFRKSVKSMVSAVDVMSRNIGQINENVDRLEDLLNRLSGAEWLRYMRKFADASDHFKTLTESLNDFERARRMMLAAAQEAINIQKSYNESLEIPREVAQSINTILTRVVRFEESINELGKDIAQTQMLGNTEIEEIKNQISAIKAKHRVAEGYIETSNNKLEMFFDSQLIELKRLENNYKEALENLFNEYVAATEKHKDEINLRHEAFKAAIDEKFELSEVRAELSNLKKIPGIEGKVDEVKRGQDKLQRTNEGIRTELNAFNAAKEEKDKSVLDRIIRPTVNSAKDRAKENEKEKEKEKEALERRMREREEADKRIKELVKKQREEEEREKLRKQLKDGGQINPDPSPAPSPDVEAPEGEKKGNIFSRWFGLKK